MTYEPIEPIGYRAPVFDRPGQFRGLRLAPYWRRVGAGIFDYFIFAGTIVPWFFADLLGFQWFDAWMLVAVFFNSCAYQGATGQSLGKRLFGIKLISSYLDYDTGSIYAGVPGVGMCVWRQVLHLWDSIVFFLGWLAPMWDPWNQTWADYKAGTICLICPGPEPLLERPAGLRLRYQDVG